MSVRFHYDGRHQDGAAGSEYRGKWTLPAEIGIETGILIGNQCSGLKIILGCNCHGLHAI